MRWATLAIRAGGDADAVDPAVEQVRGRPLRPALQGLIALVIYVVVFILAVGQALVAHLHQPSVGQTEVDPNFYIWAFRWWVFAIEHGVNPLYSHQIGAPGGYSLAWATTSPSVALLVSPITVLFGAVTSFNLVLLLAPPTAAWAAFVLARRITGRFWASLPAGAVFGFNIYMEQHELSGQPNLTVTLLLPLMAYLVVLWWDGTLGRNRYIIWMTVAIALEFYTFLEAFAEMSLLWVVGILAGLLVVDRDTRRKVVRLAVHTVVAFAGALVLASPYLIYALRNQPTTFTRQQPQFSLDLSGLIVPRKDHELGITWWAPTAGHILSPTVYVGIPMLLVLVALAITGWRTSRLVRLLVIGFVATIVLAIGPYLMVGGKQLLTLPWSGLWSLPIFKSAEPIRFIDFTYLVLGLALSLWLAALTTSWLVRAARWALGIVALAAMFADLPTFASVVFVPPPRTWIPATSLKQTNAIPEFFTDGAYKKYIQPGATVVVISHRGNAGMLFQAYTGFYFKIAGGFINASLSDVDALPVPVALLSYPNRQRERSFESYVRKANISSIIVERAWSENWMFIFGKMGMKSAEVGGVIIYSTAHMKQIPPPVTG